MLRHRSLHWKGNWQPATADPPMRQPLCAACQAWLGGVLAELRAGGNAASKLYGSPDPNDRQILFEDQCQVCRGVPGTEASSIDCVSVAPTRSSWPPLFVCASCDAWVASLATDGRSARGAATRGIDGPYGEWPHPNLRELSVEVEISDRGARNTVIESCIAMEVPVRAGVRRDSSAVLVIEVTAGEGAPSLVRATRASRPAVIVLASLAAREGLRAALEAGASAWLTLPVTPQQVTAGLTDALRRMQHRAWDPETCLPIASLEDVSRPALVFEPRFGVDPFEVAWLVKRFSRGYDEIAMAGRHIVLLPRVPRERLGEVKERLEKLLYGRCVTGLWEGRVAPVRRVDVAG